MFRLFVSALRDLFRSRASLEAEIVGLRQQVAVLKQRLGQVAAAPRIATNPGIPANTALSYVNRQFAENEVAVGAGMGDPFSAACSADSLLSGECTGILRVRLACTEAAAHPTPGSYAAIRRSSLHHGTGNFLLGTGIAGNEPAEVEARRNSPVQALIECRRAPHSDGRQARGQP